MLTKTMLVAVSIAAFAAIAPAAAGEGSPDTNFGAYGNEGRGGSYRIIVPETEWMAEPSFVVPAPRTYDNYGSYEDYNTGYAPRRGRIDLNREYDARGFNSN